MADEAWARGSSFTESATAFAQEAMIWNRNVFGHITRRKDKLLKRLEALEQAAGGHGSEAQLRQCQEELELVLFQEELLWCQKSRLEWISSGDKNTTYFHTRTLWRRNRNRVTMLKDDGGNWIEDESILLEMARVYFSGLYQDEGGDLLALLEGFPAIEASRWQPLNNTPSMEEVQAAVKAMGPLKALGKDGLSPIFFQRCWETVGSSLAAFVTDCWNAPEKIKEINSTILVLIPKIQQPITIDQFLPISLCNVAYKAITKCLAERLKNLIRILSMKPRPALFAAAISPITFAFFRR
ncbi:unnamed protein product [Linum trigynum]|uniref:Reverse transcriptase n=1 Tax=Linum trigynum TaxID=586398 RepID=A0AAV2GIR8_9ROSI